MAERGARSLAITDPTASLQRDVEIGVRIRDYRRMRRLTLKQVARETGVTESFLSQVERGACNPSVGTLHNIAAALGLQLVDFFAEEPPAAAHVLHYSDRKPLHIGEVTKYLLTRRPLQHLEIFEAVLQEGATTGNSEYTHGDSQELLYVLQGTIRLELGDDRFELGTSDSIEYRSSTPHSVSNIGTGSARALWIISPPSL